MSDFKFACIHCGQMLGPDPSLSCQRITCPACQKSLVVPWIPAAADRSQEAVTIPHISIPPVSLPEATLAPVLAREPLKLAGRKPVDEGRWNASWLATAAFVLSLLEPFGAIPAILCAHIAKAWMRRTGERNGESLATAALAIGYTCAFFTLVFLARRHLQPGPKP